MPPCSSAAPSTATFGRSRTAISTAKVPIMQPSRPDWSSAAKRGQRFGAILAFAQAGRAGAFKAKDGGVLPTLKKFSSSAVTLLRRRTAPEDPTEPAILEYQWPSTAVVNAPVPRSARSIVWLITSMAVVLVILMGLIPIDQVVTARGIVVSQSQTILVQPLDTAIVR